MTSPRTLPAARRTVLTAVTAALLCFASPVSGETRGTPHGTPDAGTAVCDRVGACTWCDTTALRPVEGVWDYPDDHVTVLVRRLPDIPQEPRRYSVCVVETPDCSLTPGERIGTLTATAEPDVFRMELAKRVKDGRPSSFSACTARLTDDGSFLQVSAVKLNIRLNLLSVVPRFWRLLRVSVDNPADRLKCGMVRVYPTYDLKGYLKHEPRYL